MGTSTNVQRKWAHLQLTHCALWVLKELAELAIPHKARSVGNSSSKDEMDFMMAASEKRYYRWLTGLQKKEKILSYPSTLYNAQGRIGVFGGSEAVSQHTAYWHHTAYKRAFHWHPPCSIRV